MTLTLIFATFVALYMAWNIGANDVANAMGTSVGSGALTLRNAVIVAAIFEFAGAYLLGGNVTDTIRKGIVDPAVFAGEPYLFVLGMLSALLAAAVWLHLASALGMPVSTTHAIVGAVAGFGIVHAGLSAVDWGMMSGIVLSWFISPMCGALLGFLMFYTLRRAILDKPNPREALLFHMPFLLFVVFSSLIFSFFKKGAKNYFKGREAPSDLNVILVSIVASVAIAGILTMLIKRHSKRKKHDDHFSYTEEIFASLQIVTACYVALAHGANDVANAMGPLAAILHVGRGEAIDMGGVPVPTWVLAMGGLGIVAGLATYGVRVMTTVGKSIIEMSPSRGFSAEFGAATTVLLFTLWGKPISTTHTLVGAVVGVGLARGMGSLNKKVLLNIATSWLATVPFAAVLSAGIYAILRALFA